MLRWQKQTLCAVPVPVVTVENVFSNLKEAMFVSAQADTMARKIVVSRFRNVMRLRA